MSSTVLVTDRPFGSDEIADQGVVNVLTDAISTDNPADVTYPNHTAHATYLVNHTEVVNNIDRIPLHAGFGVMVVPLRLVGATGSPVRVLRSGSRRPFSALGLEAAVRRPHIGALRRAGRIIL